MWVATQHYLCRREKKNSLYPPEFLSETPAVKTEEPEKKKSSLTHIPHVQLGEIQGKTSNYPRWVRVQPSTPFNRRSGGGGGDVVGFFRRREWTLGRTEGRYDNV